MPPARSTFAPSGTEFVEWNDIEQIERKVIIGDMSAWERTAKTVGKRKRFQFSLLKEIFLPFGYPASVSTDYMSYQIWDSFQALFSTLMMAISTQKILVGMGVGDAAASALSGAIAWILRDGISMISKIMFTWYTGTNLDDYNKTWRLAADIFNDLSFIVDYSISFFPDFKIYILCISGILKSIVGVSGGATRMAITQHQARDNNISDVSAKDGSQETLVNLLGLILSLTVLPLLGNNEQVTMIIFISLMLAHLYSNWRAVKALNYETFNMNRLHIVCQQLVRSNQILSIKQVNKKEPLFGFAPNYRYSIKLGVPLIKSFAVGCESYLLKYRISFNNGDKSIYVSLSSDASTEDILEAAISASIINTIIDAALRCNRTPVEEMVEDIKLRRAIEILNSSNRCETDIICLVLEFMSKKRIMLLDRLKHAGYDLTAFHFSIDSWRYSKR
ncbi:unnamed protein product [Dimorphilus gyrociliatus]|uniref:Uncharacterized protein n=1 Tax=Dimorphilus gyrociliatus TaxID=2664684 RepID=A0A7I8W1R8_9ANNE|nr:unnamed protein product [Dimorphilus gyrociliatus]